MLKGANVHAMACPKAPTYTLPSRPRWSAVRAGAGVAVVRSGRTLRPASHSRSVPGTPGAPSRLTWDNFLRYLVVILQFPIHILHPYAVKGTVSVSIFAAVNVWKDFLWPLLVLSEPSAQTINIGLYHLNNGIPEDVFIAALAIACVLTVVFFLIFQRDIMAGLTAGGVKG